MGEDREDNRRSIEYMMSAFARFGRDDQDFMRLLGKYGGESLSLADAYRKSCALQLKSFADEMPGGFFIYRATGGEELLYANDAMLRLFCCDTMEEFREWTGNSFRGIVHPEDLDMVESSIVEQIRDSRYDLDYVEYRIIRRDGEVRWVDDYGHFVDTEDGGIFYVFIGDATEKKARLTAERAALQNESIRREEKWKNQAEVYSRELETISQEHFRHLEVIEGLSIDYASILYVDLKEDMICVYRLGEQFRPLFGGKSRIDGVMDFFGRYISLWVHPEDQEMLRRMLSTDNIRKKLSNRNAFQLHFRILVENREAYRQLHVVNVGKGPQVTQVVLGFRSVDNEVRHELEQRRVLEVALEQAKTANIARNAFLANMSHDLRTPLNAIMGYTQLVQRHMDSPEMIREYIDGIESSGKLLLQLLSDVLEITKIESDQIHIEETECGLREIVGEVYNETLPFAQAKSIAVSCDVSGLEHPDVYADGGKLKEVLAHLAKNAVKYTLKGGTVSITAEETRRLSGDYAVYRFVVEDTGIGIGRDFLPHLFEPFEREKNTTQSGVEGTGLGLAITKNIVDKMGGIIEVSSEQDRGSRFTVTLSFRLIQRRGSTDERRETTLDRLRSGQKILLVEDNEINLEIEVELLRLSGFRVDTAVNGKIAVDMVKNSRPGEYALILMDIQMPVMDGNQAAQEIRRLTDPRLAGLPIVALSANAFDEDRKRSMKSGMNAHLSKPVNMARLTELLDEL